MRIGGDNGGTKRMPLAFGGFQMHRLAGTGQGKTSDNARKALVRHPSTLETLVGSIKDG
jgi:hypothetical protein